MSEKKQGGRKPSRRSKRYGNLVPAWRWRTTPARLERMEAKRQEMGISKTEFIELSIDKFLDDA